MTADEIRHYRNGYNMGRALAYMRSRGKIVTGSATTPRPYPATRQHADVAAHVWGITTALAGRPPLF